MFPKWTFFQIITLLFLVIAMFCADLYKKDIAVPMSSNSYLIFKPIFLAMLFIIIVVGCFYLITIFQNEKKTIMSHPIWSKMHIISLLIFGISTFIFIVLAITSPLAEWVQEWRWILYFIICYFLFLIYWLVLSIINKYSTSITTKKKIHLSYLTTVLILFFIIFFLPSI
ncbi:hypothetical protein DCC39_10890 [Pueribacillus theae]|uniref:Uncharacterized protein n=1 Tax=Pueribacillus theae TaxID=2171751 RepID=A0A2U1JZK9_9BACI|nr:hypothetical protein DCC39_10890 [Pueribacillus theae]